MAAAYVLRKSSDDQFYFNLRAVNNEVILTSERYTRKAGAENGIESVRVNSPNDSQYDRKTSTKGEPYFVLKAANYEIIGRSEMYSSEAARETGIASVKANGPTAPIDDQT